MGTWHLIETLAEGTATLVASGGQPKDLTSIRRLSPAPDILLEPLVAHVRQSRALFDEVLTSTKKRQSWRIYAWPIIGPFRDVHGIHLWIGDPDEEPTKRRLTSGVAWMVKEMLIYQTWESGAMSGTRLEDWLPTATPADYIDRAIHFEQETDFLNLVLNPQHGGVLSTWFSVRHDQGHAMQWQVVLRSMENGSGVRVLYHDMSDTRPPSAPSLAALGLRDGLLGAEVYVALLEARRGIIAMWVGRPAPWVEWQYAHVTGPVICPDDLSCLHEAARRIETREAPEVTELVRLHGDHGAWVKATVTLRPFQLPDRPPHADLLLAQIARADGPAPTEQGGHPRVSTRETRHDWKIF
ncbi:GAF domain-containing protein [Rhodococcus rhodochrous]|uniref:GAF domain-containing protein n=1 Tax=Rhodococcus rhodochrous TaxID=1829 RepID=UPI000A465D50|nr:GAF domain-containing protein [Rhodococcus rhodochrous]